MVLSDQCEPVSVSRASPVPPEPHRLMADLDAALVEQVPDIPQRQRKPDVRHHRQANDLRTGLEVAERGALSHNSTLVGMRRRIKQVCSDRSSHLTGASRNSCLQSLTDQHEFPTQVAIGEPSQSDNRTRALEPRRMKWPFPANSLNIPCRCLQGIHRQRIDIAAVSGAKRASNPPIWSNSLQNSLQAGNSR
jgi:hypothetical protein